MKHCAKKLLGLAFALALCLAVGGTALAQTPEFAAVPAALPEQEMLAYEPYAAPAAEGMKTIDKLATDGYTVTIPTTVEVSSTTNTGTLPVRAQLKQWRTLNITMEPQDKKWTLKYQGAAGADTPKVTYQLPQESSGADDYSWYYQHDYNMLSFSTVGMQLGTSPEDVDNFKEFSHNLTITVPHPEQATMSGTYSDTVSFEFELEKLCVTYTINIYEQKLVLNKDGWHDNGNENYLPVNAVNVVDETTGIAETDATPISTVTLEYPSWDGTTHTWTRTRPTSDGGEDERRWADLSYELTSKTDFDQNKITEKTINLNLKRKWYWLDVNGATDYTDADVAGGNQGDHIGSYVDIQVSVDETDWTNWFWQGDGDDYWQQLPYGIHFKLGLHHVKNGYVYEKSGEYVKLIANKQETQTAYTTQSADNATTYYVYEGTLTGEPTDTVDGGKIRYCYVPCYKKGLTYIANDGTGGTESVNTGNPPRSNVLYEDGGTLKTPAQLRITAPAGKSFAGWSTSADYPTTGELYKPGYDVSKITWGKYTDTSKRPKLDGKIDDEKRELYAIWGYDITVQFEDEKGYSTNDGLGPVATLGGTMAGYSFTLKGQAVDEDKGWTLDLTDSTVKEAIAKATTQAKSDAEDTDTKTGIDLARKIWKIDSYTEGNHTFDFTKECTLSAEDVKSGEPLVIQRRRYLLSVISADADTDEVNGIATDPDKQEYGTFTVTVNGVDKAHNTSFYQCGLNYGAKYEIKEVEAKPGYMSKAYLIFKLSLTKGPAPETGCVFKNMSDSYSGFMTAKEDKIHYYKDGGASVSDVYTGDPVRVAFSKDSTTGSTTPMPGPSLAPAKKTLTLRYHANFDPAEELALDLDPDPLLDDMDDTFGFDPDPLPEDVDDALEEAVKTVSYRPGEDVVLRNCMFKRGGYVFAGWNTEPDGTGKGYEVDGVPRTDWAAGDTVDLYAQWKKPEHLKPVVDDEPFVPADPDTPPEWVDDVFGVDPAAPPEDADTAFGVDPAQPEGLDTAFGVDPDPLPEALDDAFGVDPDPLPEGLDDAFGVDPDPLPEELDDAFGVDPDPQPEELDDAFSV